MNAISPEKMQRFLRALTRSVLIPTTVLALADAWVVRRLTHGSATETATLFVAQFTLCLLLAVVTGGLCAGLLRILHASPQRVQRIMGATIGLCVGSALGWAAFSGPMLLRMKLRYPLMGAAMVLTALLGAYCFPLLATAKNWRLSRQRLALLTLLIIALGIYSFHAFWFLRLYFWLHLFAALAVQLSATVSAQAWPTRADSNAQTRWKLSATLVLASLIVAIAGVWVLTHSQRGKAQLRQYSPMAKYGLLVLTRLTRHEVAGQRLDDDRVVAGRSLDLEGLDIVLVTVDALRWDRLGCYGSRDGLTPTIDSLASTGVVFERAYCTTPHTSYSLSSLMTGKYFRAVSALGNPTAPHQSLAGILRASGYATAGFFPPAVFSVDGDRLGALKARHFDFVYHSEDYASAEQRVDQAVTWLDRLPPERRAFVWVHLFEPHESYENHPTARVRGGTSPESRYASEVAAVDDAIGRLRSAFAQRHRRTAWFITADHGEEFGEHGGRFHGTTLYDEQVRVPFVLSVPGLSARRVSAPLTHVDLLSTIVRGVGQPLPPRLRGRDMGPEIHGAVAPRTIFASVANDRMALQFPWKILCDVSDSTCELYNLLQDPFEHDNVADQQPTRVRSMRSLIAGWDGSHGLYEREGAPEGITTTASDTPAAVQRGLQGDRSAAIEIARLLPNLDARRALDALLALENLGVRDRLILDAIAEASHRNARDVSLNASIALARLGSPAGLAPSRRALVSPVPLSLQRRAALGVATLGATDGLSVLTAWALAPETSDSEQDEIVRVVRALHSPLAAPLFRGLLEDLRLGPEGARGLAELGDRSAIEPLIRQLQSTQYVLTRTAALIALAQLGDEHVVERLAAFLAVDSTQVAAMDVVRAIPRHRIARGEATIVARSGSTVLSLSGPSPLPRGPGMIVIETASEQEGSVRVNQATLSVRATLQTSVISQTNLRAWTTVRVRPCPGLTRISVAIVPFVRQPNPR